LNNVKLKLLVEYKGCCGYQWGKYASGGFRSIRSCI